MAEREYTEAREIADDLGTLPTNLIITPELGAPGTIPLQSSQYYNMARLALRGANGDDRKLDTELRENYRDPDFVRLQAAITQAAQRAANEERFR